MLLVLAVNTVQLQLGRCFSELHVEPAMGMAFAKVIADCGLIDQMKVIHLVILPLMCVAIEISLGMLSAGEEFQQSRSITHAFNGAYTPVGIRIEMAKNEGWLVGSSVELFGEPF